jgi:hypothetical protein
MSTTSSTGRPPGRPRTGRQVTHTVGMPVQEWARFDALAKALGIARGTLVVRLMDLARDMGTLVDRESGEEPPCPT